MAKQDKSIRVFISSTFRDMHAERDHLSTVVFPELAERVERLGLFFYDVDLRWGVPEVGVDGESANSWQYCKQWIDRVEPFFLGILGQRYGWIPPAHEISDLDDRRRLAGQSITEMEITYALLSARQERRCFFYFRQPEVPQDTPPALFREYVDEAHARRLQALRVKIERESRRPVRRYSCRWNGSGFVGLEEFGHQVLEDLWSCLLRDERYVEKKVWVQALDREAELDPRYADHAPALAEADWEKIVRAAAPEREDEWEIEADAMARFASNRTRWFQGRDQELEQLHRFARGADQAAGNVLVVRAVPGQGKSTLVARLVQSWNDGTKSLDSVPIFISHFVGASEGSANPEQMARRILGELKKGGLSVPDVDQRKENYSSCLRDVLGRPAKLRPIVIMVDGIDQITSRRKDKEGDALGSILPWLPPALGSGVRVILSHALGDGSAFHALDHPVLVALAQRSVPPVCVDLQPLPARDVRSIVVSFLAEYCKELDSGPLEQITQLKSAGIPLYLLVMLHELRTLGGNELNLKVPRIVQEMEIERPSTVQIFEWVLERLEVFGAQAVALWCGYLALGKEGLSGDELAALLSHQLGEDGARVARRIERGLRRYLMRRGARLDFFHGQLRVAVQRRYLDSSLVLSEDELTLRAQLAQFFQGRAGDLRQSSFLGGDSREVEEMNYHLTQGRFWNALDELGRAVAVLLDEEARARLEECGQLDRVLKQMETQELAGSQLILTLRQLLTLASRSLKTTTQLSAMLRDDYAGEWVSLRAGIRIRKSVRKIVETMGGALGCLELLAEGLEPWPGPQNQVNTLLDRTMALRERWRTLIFQTNEWRYDELYLEIGCSIMKRWEMEQAGRSEVEPRYEECQAMATMEHERWCREMRAFGWARGPLNLLEKTDPRLVSWNDLATESRQELVRLFLELPAELANGNFVITRGPKVWFRFS